MSSRRLTYILRLWINIYTNFLNENKINLRLAVNLEEWAELLKTLTGKHKGKNFLHILQQTYNELHLYRFYP